MMEFLMEEYASDSGSDQDVNDINIIKVKSKTEEKVEPSNYPKECEEKDQYLQNASNDYKGSAGNVNYFGLFSCEDNNKTSVTIAEPERETVKKIQMHEHEEIAVGIPNTDFWKPMLSTDLTSLQKEQNIKVKDNFKAKYDKYVKKGNDKFQLSSGKRESCEVTQRAESKKMLKLYEESTTLHFSQKPEKSYVPSSENVQRKLYFIHPKIAPLLYSPQHCRLPTKLECSVPGHAGAVNRIKWNVPNYSHLLVSCSMDGKLKIWNVWSQLDPCVRLITPHTKAVKDVCWNQSGTHLLSCSYDKTAIITDVEKAVPVYRFECSSYVTCGRYSPVSQHLCVTGETNRIQLWDTRNPATPSRTLQYKDTFGQVQDVVFSADGSTLFSSSDLVSRDSADRNLMAWDVGTGVILSNQIYQERYTVTCLNIHPQDHNLLAQSNGNYIAIFSQERPYKMNKHKRFEGHKLQGYSIGFDVSPDGRTVYSGSSDGRLYCYNYQSGKLHSHFQTGLDVVMDTACHPVLSSVVAVCGWGGEIEVWK